MKFFYLTLCLLAIFPIISSAEERDPNCVYSDGGTSYLAICTPQSGSDSDKDNRVYVGLVWSFDQSEQSFIPDLSLGYSSLKTKSDGDVNGVDVGLRIGLTGKGVQFDSARLSYVDGDNNLMNHYGLGYSFHFNDFMGTFAVQKSHIKAGADLLMSSQTFIPYAEINSLDKPSRSNGDCLGRIIDGDSIFDYDSDNYTFSSLLNDDGNSCAINSTSVNDIDT